MAYEPIKTEELKKLVMMGRKRPMNMAYNPGPKDADLMIIDRIKAPDVLGRLAKKEGEGPKVAFGTFEIDARKFNFTVNKILPGLAKKLRKYLKTLELSFKVEIFGLDGESLEADLEDDDDGLPFDADPGPDRSELTARLRALQAPIASFGAAGAPLRKAVVKVVEQLNMGDLSEADSFLSQIEDTVARAQDRQSSSAPKAPAADTKALMARAQSLKDVLDDLPEQAAKAVKGALVQAVALLQSKDLAAADAKLTLAEKVVNTLSQRKAAQPVPEPEVAAEPATATDTAPAEADAKECAARLDTLAPEVDAVIAEGKGDIKAVSRAFDYARAQADAGKVQAALKATDATQKLIEEARNTPDDEISEVVEAPALSPEATEAFSRTRLEWTKTRSGLQAELAKLKMAIDAQTRGMDGFEDISNNTEVLLEYIEELDTSLQDTLDALLKTTDGVQRQRLMNEAMQIMSDYRGVLDTDFFKAVDGNGFVSTTIRDTALTALGEVETALAA